MYFTMALNTPAIWLVLCARTKIIKKHDKKYLHLVIESSEASEALAKIPEFEKKMPKKNPESKFLLYMSAFCLASEKSKHYMSAFIDKSTNERYVIV